MQQTQQIASFINPVRMRLVLPGNLLSLCDNCEGKFKIPLYVTDHTSLTQR